MPKKQRPLERHRDDRVGRGESAGPLKQGPEGGNQAALQSIPRATDSESLVTVEAARRHGLDLVERGRIGLDVEPRDAAQHARFVEVVSESRLSDDRKTALLERLVSDQDAAVQIERSVVDSFGTVERAEALLRAADGALRNADDSRTNVSKDDWMREQLTSGLGQDADAVIRFCHAVKMLWLLDEEEETLDASIGALLEGE